MRTWNPYTITTRSRSSMSPVFSGAPALVAALHVSGGGQQSQAAHHGVQVHTRERGDGGRTTAGAPRHRLQNRGSHRIKAVGRDSWPADRAGLRLAKWR